MFDEETHREEEDEKSQVETWSQAEMFAVAGAKTRRKKEDKKSQMETRSQTHAVEVDDEIPRCKKGAENVRVESQDRTKEVNEKETAEEENRHVEEAEKVKEVVKGERLDARDRHERDTRRLKKDSYYPNPMFCGDCLYETHHENELIEHIKTHIDQANKNMRVTHHEHENTTWKLWEDWEYANEVEEEVVTHLVTFSIQGRVKGDDGPRKEISDQKAHHKEGAEKAKEDLDNMLREGIVDEITVLEIK